MKIKRIIIFGYNPLSFELAKRLDDAEHEVTIADSDRDRLALAVKKGFKTSKVDYRSDDELRKIGVGYNIDILFCFFAEDCENVFLTLSARALAPDLEIISIVDASESAEKLLAAGANKIINPYTICGNQIYEHIKRPVISELMDNVVFGRSDLNLAEIEIPEDSRLKNSKTIDLKLNENHNLILIGLIDKKTGTDLLFTLNEKEHYLDAGDILVVLGPSRGIRSLKNEIEINNK